MGTFSTTILDHRHKGYGHFHSYISPINSPVNLTYTFAERFKNFLEWREWCQDTWGHGIDRDFHSFRPEHKWGWAVKDSGQGTYTRIYFKSVDELNWFKLRWS